MAQHQTHKRTRQGKQTTCARRTIRATKYAVRPLSTSLLYQGVTA